MNMTTTIKKLKEVVKPAVSVDRTDNTGQSRIDAEVTEVMEALNGVLGKALKKYKSAESSKKFLALLEKTLTRDIATQYVSTRLLITEKLVQAMLPDMLDSLTIAASKMSKNRIEAEANKIFETETHSVLVKLLGMEEDPWNKGNLKVDNCNGRKSAITDYIRENATAIITRIIKDSLDKFDKAEAPKLKKQISINIVKQIKEQVERNIWSSTQTYSTIKANELIFELVDSALEKTDVFKSLCVAKPHDE